MFQQQVEKLMTTGLVRFVDSACLLGTGTGEPLGLLKSPCRITVTPVSGEGVTISWQDCTTMLANSSNPDGSVWLCNRRAHDALLHLTEVIGAGGSLVQPPVKAPDGSISFMGRPLKTTDILPTLGSE